MTSTGWIKSDDGFLVMDRNANGTIDNGTELFGDSTALYAGGNAADGFAALRQEDTNSDGVVNNLDTNWANLRIWQAFNQDGISQAQELLTLEQAGIAGINVASTSIINQIVVNGNQLLDRGTYIKTDGTTGTVGQTAAIADVNLMVDTFTSQFTDEVPVTPEVEVLPDMGGSGWVRYAASSGQPFARFAELINSIQRGDDRSRTTGDTGSAALHLGGYSRLARPWIAAMTIIFGSTITVSPVFTGR